MTDFSDEVVEESKRIRAEGVRIRGCAISSQIEAGFTLLSSATQSVLLGDSATAKITLDELAHAMRTIRRHLEEPEHVPTSMLPTLSVELERLELEMKTVQAKLRR